MRENNVTGQGIFEPETHEAVTDDIKQLSDGTLDRLDDEIR